MIMDEQQRVLMALSKCVGRIEGTVNGIKEDVGEIRAYGHKTSERVGALEKSRMTARGWIAGAMAVSGGVGLVAGIIAKVVL